MLKKLSLLHVLEHYLDGHMKESKKKANICIKNNTSVKNITKLMKIFECEGQGHQI